MDIDAGSLFASLIVSGVGYFRFSYGRKASDMPKVAVGLVMLVYPYFVSNTIVMRRSSSEVNSRTVNRLDRAVAFQSI